MNNLVKTQQDLRFALQVQEAVELKAKDAQAAYDAKRIEFEMQNQDIVIALNETSTHKKAASVRVNELREQAKELLKFQFMDDLPEGFTQKRTIDVIYNRRDMRRAALAHFHHLLVLDERAVDKFIKDNATPSKEHDDLLIVSDNIHELVVVSTFYKPLPNISNATLLKLDKS